MDTKYTIYKNDARFARNFHLIGCFMILIVAGPLHFVYEWSGGSTLVSLVSPINESIWEHLKLVYWPTLLWWGFGYLAYKKHKNLSFIRWFQAMALGIVLSMGIIVVWYYTWGGAFGVEGTLVNFTSLIGVFISQLLAIHVYRVVKPRMIYFIPEVLIVLLLAFMSGYFTYYPPAFPLFVSPV